MIFWFCIKVKKMEKGYYNFCQVFLWGLTNMVSKSPEKMT